MNLAVRWLEIEKSAGKSPGEILAEVNTACGTNYKHSWLSQLQTRPSCHLAVELRRYMLAKVLPVELQALGVKLSSSKLSALINNLT